MTQTFKPREYQRTAIEFLLENPRCALWASMGAGKTVATLTAIDTLLLIDGGPVLVVAPLRVARSTWPAEVEKWAHLTHLRVVPVVGTAAQRAAALEQPADVYTTNYEQLPWLVEHFGEAWPFRTIVADESTKLKGFRTRQGTQRAHALGSIAWDRVDRFIELTGTPAPNGLQDLWGQAWFLDRGARLGRSFSAFSQRWFRVARNGFGLEPLAHAQAEIHARLGDVCLTIDVRDHFDVREPIRNVIRVALPDQARSLYEDMERALYVEIEEHGIEAFDAASRTVKCLQLANGAIYYDDAGDWHDVHAAKLDALEEVVEEAAGAPILVAYHFKHDLARLQRRFPRAAVLDADPATIDRWNAGKIPMLLAHPASGGHGLNLQHGGNILVFFGVNWNLEEHQQVIERIGPVRQMQAGYDRPVWVHYLVAEDTVDELVLKRLETKASVQDLLLDSMKRRKEATNAA